MTLNQIGWWLFGFGLGASAGVFLTAYSFIKDMSKDET